MTDERKEPKGSRKRRDETAELTIGELEPLAFEPPTGEIVMDELELVEEAPKPPPAPGMGRPRREKEKASVSTTITGAAAPISDDAPTKKAARPPSTPDAAKPSPPAPPARAKTPSMPPPSQPGSKAPSMPPPSKAAAKAPSMPPPKAKTPSITPPATPTTKSMPPPAPPPTSSSPSAPTAPPPPPAAKAGKGKRAKAEPAEPKAPPPPRAASAAPPPPAPSEPRAPAAAPAPPEPPPVDDSAEELRARLERELEGKPDPERAARLGYELGRLYEIELGDLAKAAEHYQAALRTAPDHAAALRGARRALAALGRHAALPALFDAEVKVTREPAARARLLYAKARVMEEHLRQAGPALKVYREALALDPGNLTVLKAIERALRRDKAWAELASVYEQLANAVEDPALRAAWTSVRARLTEHELGDAVQATALYESAASADPHATAALAALKRLAAANQRWPELARALRREHELCQDAEARLAILASIARIEEQRLGDADGAVKTIEEALAIRPTERALLADLVRLHAAAGRHAAEAEALSRLVEQTEGKDERAALYHRIGRIHEQDLGDADRARTWYERALGEDPAHRASALALAHLYEARGDWASVVRVWTARAEAVSAPRERGDLFHRIGAIHERRLGSPERAAEMHARALGLDPDHAPAFDDLTRLYASAQRWHELAELYQRAIDRAPHDAVAVTWLFRLGGILEDRLDDPEGAVAAYERILERDSANVGALSAVARAAERAKDWPRVVRTLEAQAARVDRARGLALRQRAAEITAEGIGDLAAAARLFEGILKDDPKHRPSLESLAQLYADHGKWEELVGVYKRLSPLLSTAAEKVRMSMRIGEIHEVQLGQDRAAIEAYREALRVDADLEPAREALLSALERSGAFAELVTALEEKLARESSPRERARIATRIGALYEEKLGKRPAALESYEKALEAMPLYRPALDARERLLTEAGDHKQLVSALSAEAAASEDPFLSTHAALRAALVLAEQQGAVAPALDAFRPVFAARPDHVGALLAVEEIYARTRDDEGLAATYEKMAEVVRDPKAKLAALEELARARAAGGGETTDVQRRILRLAPDDASALEAIAAEADKSGDRETLLAMHARLASTASDPTVGAFHQSRVGELLLAEGDAGGALAAFRAALGLDPTSVAAARGLTRAARRAKDPDSLRSAAKHEEQTTRDREVAVGLLLEAAKLRRAAGDLPGAAEDYERALALDPDDETAALGLRAARVSAADVPRLIEHLSRAAQASKKPARACALHLAVAELQADSRADLPAAVAATQRALGVRPEDAAALSRLAAYLERNAQWREAAETLEKLIAKSRDDAQIDGHLRLAAIAEKRLDDAESAIRSLRAVLKRQPDRADAIAPLIRLERGKGRDEEALRLARKLIEIATDEAQKAEALGELAQLELARGEVAAAAKTAFSAIGMLGPRSGAARVYRELAESGSPHASWDDYATALLGYLQKAKPAGAEVSATYRELARVFTEAHNRPDRAVATLREGVEACPGDADVALALVDALAKLGAHDKALAELRRLVEHDVRTARAWRSMAERVRALNEPDGAAVVLAPLVALGEATDDEKRLVKARAPRVATAPPGILGEAGLKQLAAGAPLDQTATALLYALSDVIIKLEGVDYEKHGVTKRDRIRAGEPGSLRSLVDRIGVIFGIPEVDLFVVSRGLERPVIEPGGPPALFVPASLTDVSDARAAFELARPLALLSRHLHPLDHIAPELLENILVGAARQYEADFALGPVTAELEVETRRVAKALPWLQRGRIQDAATSFAAQPTDVRAWARDVHRMAARAALLVSDDLLAALAALGEPLGPDNTATDLARFWVSDPATRFRRAVAQQI